MSGPAGPATVAALAAAALVALLARRARAQRRLVALHERGAVFEAHEILRRSPPPRGPRAWLGRPTRWVGFTTARGEPGFVEVAPPPRVGPRATAAGRGGAPPPRAALVWVDDPARPREAAVYLPGLGLLAGRVRDRFTPDARAYVVDDELLGLAVFFVALAATLLLATGGLAGRAHDADDPRRADPAPRAP